MSVQLTPSKRPYDGDDADANGNEKWQKTEAFNSQNSPSKFSRVVNEIRVLCPVSRIGSMIGNGDDIISQICQDSGAKVQVEEIVPGCDERVIIISGSDKDIEMGSEQSKADGGETDKSETGVDAGVNDKNDENKLSVSSEHFQRERYTASLKKALFLLFERISEVGSVINGGEEDDIKHPAHVLRLILHSSQVGCLVGKSGSKIKQLSSESGAEMMMLPKDKLPLCASSTDDLVQISGELDAVKKALQSVCQQLLEYSQDEETVSDPPPSRDFSHPSARRDTFQQSNHSFRGHGPPISAGYPDSELGFPARTDRRDVLSFRLLCPDEKVGGVIGKGGTIIKALQHETGCEIKVLEGVADSEDRVIIISGPAHPDDRISAVQDAVLRVHSRILRAAPESKEKNITAKLLVSSNQIGCLLGKGGGIIAEMRKLTGAYIRILGKEHIPKNAAENEEVVQISGELEAVHEALMQITARLQNHFFRDAFPSNPAFMDQMAPFPSYRGRRDFSPRGMYSNMGPPYRNFDAVGGLHPLDDRPPFVHDFHRPQIPERMPSSAPWVPQGMIDGGGPMGFADYAGAPPRRVGGFGGGNHPAIITSTTMEVVVPRSVVPAIYGEDGGCLRQICEISDAKVTITDPKPGATETVIIISGTPEQTNAAQSLIQAFVISETEAA